MKIEDKVIKYKDVWKKFQDGELVAVLVVNEKDKHDAVYNVGGNKTYLLQVKSNHIIKEEEKILLMSKDRWEKILGVKYESRSNNRPRNSNKTKQKNPHKRMG